MQLSRALSRKTCNTNGSIEIIRTRHWNADEEGDFALAMVVNGVRVSADFEAKEWRRVCHESCGDSEEFCIGEWLFRKEGYQIRIAGEGFVGSLRPQHLASRLMFASLSSGAWIEGPPTNPGYYAIHVPLDEHRIAERIVRFRQVDIEANGPQTNNANIADIIIHFPLPDPPEPKPNVPAPPAAWIRVRSSCPSLRGDGWGSRKHKSAWSFHGDDYADPHVVADCWVTVLPTPESTSPRS
jgi:hypothetical protein